MAKAKKITILSLISLFFVILPLVVFAGNKQYQQSIYVGPQEIIEGNFIKAGQVIDIQGAVNGDVIVAGGSITITGPVAGDVIAAGNIIRINGSVGGSIRLAASSVEISSEVKHNVWAVASSVNLSPTAKVGWDVYGAAATFDIKGPVDGNVWVTGTAIVIASQVGKDVAVSVDDDGQIILYPEAKVGGNLSYKAASDDQLIIKEGAEVVGQTARKEIAIPTDVKFNKFLSFIYIFFEIISLFSLLVIGLILVSLLPKFVLQVRDEMMKKPWPSLGWGLIYLIVTPIIAVFLMITIIGIPLGIIIIPVYVITIYVSKVFAGFAVGLLIADNLAKDKKYKGTLVWPLVVGLVLLTFINFIPIIGFIVKFFLVLWALGAIIQVKKDIWREYQ